MGLIGLRRRCWPGCTPAKALGRPRALASVRFQGLPRPCLSRAFEFPLRVCCHLNVTADSTEAWRGCDLPSAHGC